ncbi:MAG: TRASH domain-containing protein [Candidatus Asgardarchaeum sp.]
MVKLDEYDLKILYLLRDNSRLSISELAGLLGLSRPTVKTRLERLEKEGIIQKYTIKILPELERTSNTIIMIVKTNNSKIFDKFEEIVEINKFANKRYIIKVVVKDMNELRKITENAELDVLKIIPILESKEKERPFKIRIQFKCDYCGKEIIDKPIVYKYHNRVYFFCCQTCLREFKKMTKRS